MPVGGIVTLIALLLAPVVFQFRRIELCKHRPDDYRRYIIPVKNAKNILLSSINNLLKIFMRINNIPVLSLIGSQTADDLYNCLYIYVTGCQNKYIYETNI